MYIKSFHSTPLNRKRLIICLILLLLSKFCIASSVDIKNLDKKYSMFKVRLIMRLDTGSKDLIDIGLFDIDKFTVDESGIIYLLNSKNNENMIFLVDKTGIIKRSFGKKGQGPGELENPTELFLSPSGNLIVLDMGRGKLSVFSKEGSFIEEKRISPDTAIIDSLSNGCFLGLESFYGGEINQWGYSLNYYDEKLNKIKELDRVRFPNPIVSKTVEAGVNIINCKVSADRIYSGCPKRGYEFMIFDLTGKLINKICVTTSKRGSLDEFRKIMERDFGDLVTFGIKVIYPRNPLPYYSFFADDNGYLFVMTFQPGNKAGDYLYEIINPLGKIVNKVSLGPFFFNGSILAKISKNMLYMVRQKETGDKEFIVYEIQ
ncbi:MAG: 6-bladed beta-propeller [Candidatus Aminicenantes bacterium]|nr:6-bladed beta-propeller [Candidatus Aminicenantes bacterium]